MRPCPNCAWMLKETDSACTMCGAAIPGAAPAPPPAGGAYAPPGPPGYGAVAPPPPVPGFGASPPPAPVSPGAYPPAPQPTGGYGGAPAPAAPAAFSSGAVADFPVSPWARAAPPAQPQMSPMAAGAAPVAGMPPMAAPIGGVQPAAIQPMAMPGSPSMGGPAPVPTFGAPPPVAQPGIVAPPPMVQGGVVGGVPVAPPAPVGPLAGTMNAQAPGVAPPPFVAPPPMVSGAPSIVNMTGPVGGPAPTPMASPGSRVLVGFLVTFQNDPGGSFWPIYSGRIQLGRGSADTADSIALSDASASSRHASVHADPTTGQAFVEDDGSRNGTFLNEQRLGQGERRQLRDNDRLRLGSTTFVVKLLVA